ncbi:MAG: monooxygenase, partial [Gammaproteobacteria bacterium]|nr:monooxygenase [Gammaproteobacteria bacterium]
MAVQTETFDIDNLDFDPDALRRRYDHERDRRLQPRGEDQYLETKGDYAEYFDPDPYSGEAPSRDPLTLTPDVI